MFYLVYYTYRIIFSAVHTHHITIGDYYRDSKYTEYIRQRCVLIPEINTNLLERNTVLQVRCLKFLCF
jgi:hypothetical protein